MGVRGPHENSRSWELKKTHDHYFVGLTDVSARIISEARSN